MKSKYKFTVFTSCFNSIDFIERLYRSLKAQTFTDFEWLIVDDCSQDGTWKMLESFKNDAKFDVRIFHNETNKMISYCCNLAVNKAQGEFFLFLDHDDEIVPNALERFNEIWNSIDADKKLNLVGMMSNCKDQFGNFVRDELPDTPCIMSFYSIYYDLEIKGEKFFCYLTKILQENNFSTVDRYVPENVMLLDISDFYDTYFFNENLRIYHINQEGHQSLADNLANGWKIKFPVGMRYAKLQDLNRRSKKIQKKPILLFKTIVNFARFSLHSNIPIFQSIREINSVSFKCLIVFFMPFSISLYLKDMYLK